MEDISTCSRCNTQLTEEDIFCPNCGYPEKASEEEKKKYDYRIKLRQDIVDDAKKKLKNVKILLYVIIGLNVVLGIYYLTDEFTVADGIGNLIAALIFAGCLVWVNKKPLAGILAAFIFWLLLQLSVVLIDPALLFSGLLLKVLFFGVFIKGITSARDYVKYTAQLEEMNAN